jgi:hypothetical protein
MAILPFRWQTKHRAEQVRVLLASRAEQWCSEWSGHRSLEVVVSVASPEQKESVRLGQWYALRTKEGVLHVNARSFAFGWLGCLLTNSRDENDSGIAQGVGRRALMDLIMVLSSGASDDQIVRLDLAPGRDVIGLNRGVVHLRCLMAGAQMDVYVDAALCNFLVPALPESKQALTPLQEAILPGEIDLDIVLDLGSASIEDTLTLKPGEVVKTSIRVDSIVHATFGDSHPVFSAKLVADGGHRALRCLGHEFR